MTLEIIFIGGAPTMGKTTLAASVAQHLGVPLISTDLIRDEMRTKISRAELPRLFDPEGYDTAEKYLNKFSAEEIVALEMDQGEAVWPEIKKLIAQSTDGLVIEGISILPHLIAADFSDSKNIKAIFLGDSDLERMRHIIYTRGIWDDANTYSDDVKAKELEWAQLFNEKIKIEVQKYNFPWIDVEKNENDLKLILSAICI